MDTGFLVVMLTVFVLGVVGGMVLESKLRPRPKVQGVLNIDCGDPDYEPSLFLQLEVPVDEIIEQEQTVFTVRII